MPKDRPPTSGYARIAQDEEHGYLDDSDEEGNDQHSTISTSVTQYAPIQHHPPGPMRYPDLAAPPDIVSPFSRRGQHIRRNSSGVDIKAINARLERWAEEIASKFKIGKVKGKTEEEESLEIHHSVFQPPEGVRPVSAESLTSLQAAGADDRIDHEGFERIVESVRIAIEMGIHPSMISQGSSGSYFARNADGTIVGVFKPKDEEPYASRNPKWTKWLHRNLFPCCFGRACLIPNLSYVSEAAAYVLDHQLQTNLVPYTDIVRLSSKSFFYDYWDRRKYYHKQKAFPAKIGSFQVFLKGFKDANIFLREHPWPDQQNPSFRTDAAPKRNAKPWAETCRPRGAVSEDEEGDGSLPATAEETERRKFFWTDALRTSFREELEKLVILDYIMRNTDRGLDNWMVKVDWQAQRVSIVSEPPKILREDSETTPAVRVVPRPDESGKPDPTQANPYKLQRPMNATSRSATPNGRAKEPSIGLGAIDNSLSWPWKHPDAWRSFPFGWLFLPVSLIGQPFSQKTRDHFLPLLTSTVWWSSTQTALRHVFSQDSDFQEKMFARQIAVMKGQAWNVVETLKIADHGPLELTRRARVCVWDDLIDIPVSVPLRVPSAEMRRRRNADLTQSLHEEEMDISAANNTGAMSQNDLLGLGTPITDLPHPNRFNLSRSNSTTELHSAEDRGEATERTVTDQAGREEQAGLSRTDLARPSTQRTITRASFEEPFRSSLPYSGHRRRGHSLTMRRSSGMMMYENDDIEGDLGYAAAAGMEQNQRKVIVERLEMVKGKSPVFTWC